MSKLPEHHEWIRKFSVSSPTLHKKGYTIYRVVSKVFPKNSVEATSQVVVWKRYNDFKKLYKSLLHIYKGLHLKGEFPKFPKAQIFGRFQEDVIEARRQSALLILEFAARYPVLYNSQVFAKFFEGGEQCDDQHEDELSNLTPPLVPPSSQSGGRHEIPQREDRTEEGDDVSSLGFSRRSTPEILSMSSRTTDDDMAEYEFTPWAPADTEECEKRSVSFRSTELAKFDPVLQGDSATPDKDTSSYPSNAWILSAVEVCSHLTDGSPPECSEAFIFPKPFQDVVSDGLPPFGEQNTQPQHPAEQKAQKEVPVEGGTAAGGLAVAPLSPLDVEGSRDNKEADYLREAAEIVTEAYKSEASGDFVTAFSHYKTAVAALLGGVQNDRNTARREAVRRKTAQYLTRAEQIYSTKLTGTSRSETRWTSDIPRSREPSPRPVPYGMPVGGALRGSVQELGNYKVIGVVGKVLLVLDTHQNTTVAMKVLWKSPCPAVTPMPSVVPRDIAFMVQLLKLYETDYAYFLVLQYAPGGRLWDYLGTTVHGCSDIASSATQGDTHVEDINVENASLMPLSGSPKKAPSTGFPSPHTVKSDLDRVPASYLALFTSEPSPHNSLPACSVHSSHSAPCIEKRTMGSATDELVQCNIGVDDLISNAELLLKNIERTLKVCDPDLTARKSFQEEPVSTKVERRSAQSLGSQDASVKQPKSSQPPITSTAERKDSLPYRAAEAFERLDGALAEHRKMAPLRHLPESCVRLWAAEISVALMQLHRLGLVWKDLTPKNVLLSDGGHVMLTYCCQFNCVDSSPGQFALEHQYSAPEICNLGEVTPACDWWSFGALLYELFVGVPLHENYPGGVTASTQIELPNHLSNEAVDLLKRLLTYNPHQRLGYGSQGANDIRNHRFFVPISWAELEPK
ncbi:ribosomal protein S6 kinase delta-1-like [Ornithodoros turicata]|uniref:ribosomal protein S6 kinase delta-1-like n=1 Tax=Ornithodoros turicata TaxID=34597 RepID=UPI0031397F2A